MGLRRWLGRVAARRVHTLVIEVPGSWLTRATVERTVLHRGWVLASSPADADVVVVCGTPTAALQEFVDRVFDQLPGPRRQCRATTPDEADEALDAAARGLVDVAAQRADDSARTGYAAGAAHGESPTSGDDGDGHEGHERHERHEEHGVHDNGDEDMDHGDVDHGDMDHGDMDHGDMDHGDMDHGDMDHGDMDHGDMDHGGMDMSPGGIPLAEGGEDRDGLEMDVLTVHLGPVLPHWPPGLVLSCHLHGDVVAAAEARLVGTDPDHPDRQPGHLPPGASSREWAARRCDRAVDVLALAGWDDGASRARHARDVLLGEDVLDSGGRIIEDLLWSTRRSRMLRWSLRGIRPLSPERTARAGLADHLAGDVMDRLVSMLMRALTVLGEAEPPVDDVGTGVSPDVVAELVTGLDLATARLVVASLDIDLLGSREPAPGEEVARA